MTNTPITLFVFVTLLLAPFAIAEPKPFEETTLQGIAFIRIPAGSFTIGTSDAVKAKLEEAKQWTHFENAEQPAHKVTLDKPFLISKYEITQKQWKALSTGTKKVTFAFKGDDLPADSVSFEDVSTFLYKMNKNGTHKFRLPTEAEWEYCARCGSDEAYGKGQGDVQITDANLGDYAWYAKNAGSKTHPVGQKKPNAWGLYDMMGNVWEWTRDWYIPTSYTVEAQLNPVGKDSENSTERVIRGGSWFVAANTLRPAFRSAALIDTRSAHMGFRLVCDP